MIKKFLIIAVLLLSVMSCQRVSKKNAVKWSKETNKLKVLSTTPMIDYMVGQIGGDNTINGALITGNLDPHSYELVKGDNDKIGHADVIFYNGLGLEHGASLKTCLQKHAKAVSIAAEIEKKWPNEFIYLEGIPDPHIWMDVGLFAKAIDPIVSQLSDLDPEHQEAFRTNGQKLLEKMLAVDLGIKKLLKKIPSHNRYLITTHDAFFYFSRAYLSATENDYFERVSSPEGLAPDGQMSFSDILGIVDFALKYNISVLFSESNVSQDALKKVVSSIKKKQKRVKISPDELYGDAVGAKGSGAENYLEMMVHNARVIAKNLRGDHESN